MSARDEGGAYARIRENLSELGLDLKSSRHNVNHISFMKSKFITDINRSIVN